MTPIPDQWYIQFDGQMYGPFPHAQMQDFVIEGRVIAESLITTDPARGFFQASAFPVFGQWLQERERQQFGQQQALQLQNQVQSQAQAGALTLTEKIAVGQSHQPQAHQMASPRVFMVMAEIRSGNDMRFLRALQAHGVAQRIGDTVWLLRATCDVEDLCQVLSQSLSKQDRLFLLDSFNNKTAWFNIGADMDTRIRQLWSVNAQI